MSNAEDMHENIFLFEIVQPEVGFAKFGNVHKRRRPATRRAAADEIKRGAVSELWQDVKSTHDGQNLDMRFARNTQGLVFVQLPTKNSNTVFGHDAVRDLAVKRKGSKKIVRQCNFYSEDSKPPRLCSFEINIGDVVFDIGTDAEAITRLPIMFDFVDFPEEVSPVFKAHDHKLRGPDHKANKARGSRDGHGGIHPPSGSSLILVV